MTSVQTTERPVSSHNQLSARGGYFANSIDRLPTRSLVESLTLEMAVFCRRPVVRLGGGIFSPLSMAGLMMSCNGISPTNKYHAICCHDVDQNSVVTSVRAPGDKIYRGQRSRNLVLDRTLAVSGACIRSIVVFVTLDKVGKPPN